MRSYRRRARGSSSRRPSLRVHLEAKERALMFEQPKRHGAASASTRRRLSALPLSRHLPVLVLAVAAFVLTLGPATAAPTVAGAAGRQLVIDTQYDQLTADPARDASISGRYGLGSVYDTLTSFKAKQVNGKL